MAQKLLGAPTIGRGVPRQGVVVGGVKGAKKAPSWPKHKKALKIYTSEMFFEEYIYFKIFG
jgi:hypothetical protein